MAVQVPVLLLLNWLYLHRPIPNPRVINFDVRLYFEAASNVLNGQWPYRDFFFPYPPYALLGFIPPRLVSSDLPGFFTWFKVELLAVIWIGVVTTAVLARRLGQRLNFTLLFYSCGLVALGSIVPQRYDLIPAIFVLLALAAWLGNHHDAAWLLLAVGTLVKAYPALLVPILTISAWRTGGWRAVARGWVLFGGAAVVLVLPLLIAAPNEASAILGGPLGRGVGIESTYALLLLLGKNFGLPVQAVYQAKLNIWNVVGPQSEVIEMGAPVLGMIALLVV